MRASSQDTVKDDVTPEMVDNQDFIQVSWAVKAQMQFLAQAERCWALWAERRTRRAGAADLPKDFDVEAYRQKLEEKVASDRPDRGRSSIEGFVPARRATGPGRDERSRQHRVEENPWDRLPQSSVRIGRRAVDVVADMQRMKGQRAEERPGLGLRAVRPETLGVIGRCRMPCATCRTTKDNDQLVKCGECMQVFCEKVPEGRATELPGRYQSVKSCWEHHVETSTWCAEAEAKKMRSRLRLEENPGYRRPQTRGYRDTRGDDSRMGRRSIERTTAGTATRSSERDSARPGARADDWSWGRGESRARSSGRRY